MYHILQKFSFCVTSIISPQIHQKGVNLRIFLIKYADKNVYLTAKRGESEQNRSEANYFIKIIKIDNLKQRLFKSPITF